MQINDVLFNLRTSIEPSVFVEGYDKAPDITELSIDSIVNSAVNNASNKIIHTFSQELGDLKDSVFSYKYCTGHTQQTILDKISESYDHILQAIQHIDLITPAIIVGGLVLLGMYIFKR